MEFAPPGGPDDHLLSAVLWSAGDEAILPIGSVLVDQGRVERHCYLIVEGEVAIETLGRQPGTLGPNNFVGEVDLAGLPTPLSGATVRVQSPARVLVIDPVRLAARIHADPALVSVWRRWMAEAAAATALQRFRPTMPPNDTPLVPRASDPGGTS